MKTVELRFSLVEAFFTIMSQQGDLILIGVYLGLSVRDCGVIWPYTICIPLPFEGYSIRSAYSSPPRGSEKNQSSLTFGDRVSSTSRASPTI